MLDNSTNKTAGLSVLPARTKERKGTVLLGHAMFNNSDYFFKPAGNSFADFLTSKGFDILSFNLCGHGPNEDPSQYNFDDYVTDYREKNKIISERYSGPFYYIGHSVGSLAGLSALAGDPQWKRFVLVAPAVFTFQSQLKITTMLPQSLLIPVGVAVSQILGSVPAKLFGIGKVNGSKKYFAQFFQWIIKREVNSVDGNTNYCREWGNAACPTLILSGKAEKFMAPHENVAWVARQIGQNAKVESVSENSRFGFDAGHFDIIYGKKAADKVWPEIVSFLEE